MTKHDIKILVNPISYWFFALDTNLSTDIADAIVITIIGWIALMLWRKTGKHLQAS